MIRLDDSKTTSGDRLVYISEKMRKSLKAWQKESAREGKQTVGYKQTDVNCIFHKRNGEPTTLTRMTTKFHKMLKTNDLPLELSVHSLRHTNTSQLIAQGVDVCTAASLLSHAQASMTLGIYAHAFDKNKSKTQKS